MNKYVKKCLKLNDDEINKEKKLNNIMQNIREKLKKGISKMKGNIFYSLCNNIYQKDSVKKENTDTTYSYSVIL